MQGASRESEPGRAWSGRDILGTQDCGIVICWRLAHNTLTRNHSRSLHIKGEEEKMHARTKILMCGMDALFIYSPACSRSTSPFVHKIFLFSCPPASHRKP